MKTAKILAVLFVTLGLVRWLPAPEATPDPVRTAFTYQGHLYDANHVADGLYDFQFKLFDSLAGNQVDGDVNKPDVDVIAGYFTVELDFGNVYDGNERWLEISVRPGEMNDPNIYTTLEPRQEVTAAPYALYAKTSGGDNDWMVSGNDMYSIPSGKVGIGTSSPGAKLQVGDTDVGHDVYIAGSTSSQSGLFFYDGSIPGGMRYNFSSDDLSIFTAGTTNLMIDSAGKVGIGTTSPAVKLQVGDTDVGHDVYIAGATSSQSGLFFYDGGIPGGMRYNFSTDDLSIFTAGTARLMINSSGNVGIGTTNPGARLQVGDTSTGHDVYIAGSTSSQSGLFFYDGGIPGGMRYNFSTDDLSIFTAGSTRVMIDSAGDVGIGTLAPTEKLDVDGTARLRGISNGAGSPVVVDANGTLWKTVSSKRYKRNIADLEIDADAVLELRPVSFQYKSSGQKDIGLIAEEVQEQLPDLVIYDEQGRPDAVKYDKVSLYLLAVVKELKAENESLKQRVEALERTKQQEFGGVKEVQQ